MPAWAGKWKGGRFYLDSDGRPVFFIERRKRSIKLQTHDEELAKAQLAQFLASPETFAVKHPRPAAAEPVYITETRINLYIESIQKTVRDHRAARSKYLVAWGEKGMDLRAVDRNAIRLVLASFAGGHRGRTEALNAFCRFLVREGDLERWSPLVNHRDPEETRAERVAYSLEQLKAKHAALVAAGKIELGAKGSRDPSTADLFYLRAVTGMHHTELQQLEGARIFEGPLPDKGTGIRVLGGDHEIQGVLQVVHKSRRQHRQSVDAAGLRAALRLREHVPSRITMFKAIDPLVPSNLRHTFITLAGEVGVLVTYSGAGVDRSRVAQIVGHRAGSTMTADRYDKTQVPPMVRLPIDFDVL